VADKDTKRQLPVSFNAPARLTVHGLAHGIALYNRRANKGEFGDFQMIAPPLTSTEGEIDELVHLLELALNDLLVELRSQGLVA
jgi:adenosylmethionine-8-amino-7-oxononanoate aminotransferase